ncbi:MAG TPA: glycosyltransferase family 9 protein [Candidatus Baltobacteraceae bacterium]|nr:glycosyltransferase family 9 protein [Candidatus Baltobacteraceae bacterium]
MHILLSRTDRIGDLILSTAAIATVRKSFPQARVTMVCSPYNRVVMERNTDVDEIVEFVPGTRAGDLGRRFRGLVQTAIALAPRKDDLAIAGGTRAPVRVGYTYVRRYVARLTAPLYVNRLMISEADPALSERRPQLRVRHEVTQLVDLVALAGARDRVETLRLDVTEADRSSISYLPAEPIVFHLGMRWFVDGSTLDSTVALVQRLHDFGRPVVVTYAPECEQFVDAFVESRAADVVLGGLPFHRWAAVFERARLVITVDTGATHVASAVRRPTVVAFEHRFFRLNSQEWAPYAVPCRLVRKPGDESPESLARFRNDLFDAVGQLLND